MDKVTNIKGFDTLDLESMVFTSEVVEWELEVRCFVLNNQLITHSSYWRNDAFETNQLSGSEQKELFDFFENFIQQYGETLPKAIVLDLGSSKEKAGL